eukprot:scaffold85789_cov63-Phaeocystis_antarctica.AAC.1
MLRRRVARRQAVSEPVVDSCTCVLMVSSGATAAHVQKAAKVPAAAFSAMSGVSQRDGILSSVARDDP